MTAIEKKQQRALLRKKRVRGKLHGTAERPRLTVFRSNKNTYVQAIDDDKGVTLASANDLMMAKSAKKELAGTKLEKAEQIAQSIADQLKKKNITQLCFDRGSFRYHGRLKAIAETVRAAGIKV